MSSNNVLKKPSLVDKFKQKTYSLTVFIAVIALATAITFVALNDGASEVTQAPAIVFTSPIRDEFTVIKEFSSTELFLNQTLKQWESHKAIDFKADSGAAVLAVYDGKVLAVENHALFGYRVIIEHTQGVKTVYASLRTAPSVAEGDIIVKGQKIGEVGNTASVEEKDGPHLHFEVWQNEKAIDPGRFLNINNNK